MKFFAIFVLFAVLATVAVDAFREPIRKPFPTRPIPTFPGQGPFNPKIVSKIRIKLKDIICVNLQKHFWK